MTVQGRGKEPVILSVGNGKTVKTNFLTKEYFIIEVDDEAEETVVKKIMDVNKTGKPGDGRIFVSPAGNTYSVRGNASPDEMADFFLPEELI
jgi:nitrogen regulatory protein PII